MILGAVLLFTSLSNNELAETKTAGNTSKRLLYSDTESSGPKSLNGNKGFRETMEEIMSRQRVQPPQTEIKDNEEEEEELVRPDRSKLPQNPESKNESSYPPNANRNNQNGETDNPQAVSTNWTAATVLGLNPTLSLPADNMGAVGPTQYIVAVNGRMVSFNKTTGVADGIMNVTPDVFFVSVRNGASTSDPRIRYDRMSQRWFLVIINVSTPNRILFAVSNTSNITAGTVWTFFFINISTITPTISATCLADYPTLGIDNLALYIGTNNFCGSPTQTYNSSDGYVINKANLIAGTLTATVFRGLVPTDVSDGPYTPQGVDNFDASSTQGYFIGVSNAEFGKLVMRRVSTPGGTPTISSDIAITVNTTTFPEPVNHLGNTGGTNGRMSALDDRLFAACIRNGRLWTAHNFEVNASGVANTSGNRMGSRWYELTNLTGTPTVNQSGTIFDAAATNPISYWIPSVMVSGQNHAAFIFSSAGLNNRINESTAGRLTGDALGTTQAVVNVTASTTAYNQASDPGGLNGRRWGDYSYVSLDPNDDMTMWGVMGFCDAANSYGVRVVKLLAPPPPALTSANPNVLNPGQSNVNIIITGTPTTGQGFYDPGAGFTNRISATIDGGVTVNSTTYNSATQVTLNVSTVGATTGNKTITITNPDGQFVSSNSLFSVPLPVAMASFTSSVDKRSVKLLWVTSEEINNQGFDIERASIDKNGALSAWVKIGFVQGKGYSNTEQSYSYNDINLNTGKYSYRLKQIDFNGNYEHFALASPVAIGIPAASEISQNYPNPFNPLTKINYGLSVDGKVSLVIYDINGREVAKLVDEVKPAGYYTAEFNASTLASGVYFYKITTADLIQVRKMLVVK